MRIFSQLLLTTLLLTLSGQLFAHAGPIGHMAIENNTLHFLLHIGMTLVMGLGAFFISRWVISLLVGKQNKLKH